MRWYILKALLVKETQRHLANRGGIALGLMLVVAALLLSVFNPDQGSTGTGLIGGVHHCYIDMPDADSPWTKHLRANISPELSGRLIFRRMPPVLVGAGSIRVEAQEGGYRVELRYPQGEPDVLGMYEDWFWRETRRFLQAQVESARPDLAAKLPPLPELDNDLWPVREAFARYRDQVEAMQNGSPRIQVPELSIERAEVKTTTVLDAGTAVAMGLVVFSLFFTCVYLLPAFTCEERERGVLLAQALSPASPIEILVAKFLFYPLTGMGLAAILASIYAPTVLLSIFFWLSLLTVSIGFLGIGMVVACLAKTQRAASIGALTYAMCVTLILMICQQNNIPLIPQLALEYHGPKILHAAIQGRVMLFHWAHLMGAFCLAIGWCAAAAILFRRRGWQ